MSMPYGIAVAAQEVYWTDRKAGKIQRLILRCDQGVQEVPSRMNSTMVRVPRLRFNINMNMELCML